nr:immunoglobulin light chain junction region [Macaca mulatta]
DYYCSSYTTRSTFVF